MRVAHVVRQFSPSVGGLEDAVLQLCMTLRGSGIEASVITLDRVRQDTPRRLAAHDSIGGVPVTRVPFFGSWRYPVAPAVLSKLDGADVVHVHAIDFFFDFLALTKGIHRKPLVASTHGGFFHTDFARRLKALYFRTITRTSAASYERICASSRSDLALFHGIAPHKVALVENGVDVSKWHDRAARQSVRTMIAIGRLAANKQLPKLIPLIAALRGQHPDWSLIIAGRRSDLSGEDLRRLALQAGVSEAVDVIVDPSEAAIASAIGRASYVVSASRFEGFGLSIVEGLSAGLVPLLNRIPAFESLAEDTPSALLFDIDQPTAAAAAIEDAHQASLGRDAARRSLCMAAAGRYSWARSAAAFTHHYSAAVERRDHMVL